MYQVAVYGKGGIGKSTISANISVALAERGIRVMQVGCDPKHDSTRLLLGGRTQTTVLEYLRSTPLPKRSLGDVIETGTMGVLCTEAGGPEPGIGCAGRGILTTFDTLRKLGADELDVDVRLYDVLGDVVCGGFAVPLRGEYADAVVLVTSGEFMAMYAANNIMRGMLNFDTGRPRLLGIVLNSRGVEGERDSVRRFAEATGTRVIAEIPRDRMFADAESRGHTVMELFPESEIASGMRTIADAVAEAMDGNGVLTTPRPLDDAQLSDLAAGREIRPGSGESCRQQCTGCRRGSIRGTRVMGSCAAYGAAAAFMKVSDAAVVLHGPMSCAYLMATSRAKAVLDLYGRGIFDTPPGDNLRCTMMDDSASIFGGDSFLEWSLENTISEGFGRVAVVTTCMPGIIGDDCLSTVDSVSSRHPDASITLVPADGDIEGDFTDGFLMAAGRMAGWMDTSLDPQAGLVNLVGTTFHDLHSKEGEADLRDILSPFGLRVNCRFLDETTSDRVAGFCRGTTDIMVSDTRSSRDLMSVVTERTGREPFPSPLPVGLREHIGWLEEMGRATGLRDEAEAGADAAIGMYTGCVSELGDRFEGKRVLVATKLSSNVDWLVDLLDDLGADVVRIGFAPSSRKAGGRAVSRHMNRVTEGYTDEDMERDIREQSPDVVIADSSRAPSKGIRVARLGRTGVGCRSTIRYARYLDAMMRVPEREGWRSVA